MGILGTSAEEEAQLRAAAAEHNPRQSLDASSYTGTSAYETADEDISDDEYPTQVIADNQSNRSTIREAATPFDDRTSNATDIQRLEADSADENELNRIYTLDRLASRKSIQEEADGELRKSLSRVPTQQGIKAQDLDWDGPDDKDNPQNWPKWKKWFITMTTANVCLCVSLGSSLYVSGVPELMEAFGASQLLCLSGLTFYLVGLALGPVFMAPLSEIIGRRWIYITSFPLSMLFTMGIGLAKNIRTVLILRFFCGYIASPALSIAGGSVSDLWSNSPSEMSIAVALFCVAPFLGPIIGPIVGGFAAEYKGWEWTMWVSLMFSGFVLPFIVLCPETYKPIILVNRAKKRGIKVITPKFNMNYVKSVLSVTLFKPLEMLVVEPIVSLLSIYIAFVFAVLFGFFEAFPIIFRGVYHMDLGVSGLPFIGVGLGLIFGVLFYIVLDLFYYFPKNPDGTRGNFDENGKIIWDAPEKKLLVGKIGAVCLPVALFWLAWTGRNDSVHWMAPTASGFPFGFGLILVFFAVVLYFSMSFPPICVASALAANNLLRYLVASVFPLFTVQMYEKLEIDWATSLFAFIALAMVPLPFVFAIWGPKLRAKSKFGYHAYFKKIAEEKAAAAAAAAAAAPATASSDATISESAQEKPESSEPVENKV